jgi:nucleoid DNA-binding protein
MEMPVKLNELSESIATTCDLRPRAVLAVQKETFRQLRAALEKGERVIIPEFGKFSVKDVPEKDGKPGRKIMRFKASADDGTSDDGEASKKAKRKAKKNAQSAESAETAPEGSETPTDSAAE